jgi:hypothetical protein
MSRRNPRIGFAFSTKDRTDLSRRCLRTVDFDDGFDLLWCDGSNTAEGQALPKSVVLKRNRFREIHLNVRGGPDAAICFGLRRLLALGYDCCGLIENDIEFDPGWLQAMREATAAARADGLKVGAVTARTFASRVLLATPQYALIWNVGAGMVLFSRPAVHLLLNYYHTRSASEICSYYADKFGKDLRGVHELFAGQIDRGLGCDWGFSIELYRHGLVSIGTVPSHARIMDYDAFSGMRSEYQPAWTEQTAGDWQRELRSFKKQNAVDLRRHAACLLAPWLEQIRSWRIPR